MIRKATLSDMPVLLGISHRSFDTTWSMASFEAEFHKDHAYIYIYTESSTSVAFLIVWDLGAEGEIVSLAVDKGWRNRGIASKLLRHAFLAHSNVEQWHLEVEPGNTPALSLYHKNGFVKQRIIKDYYAQGKDALQMDRKVLLHGRIQ